MPIELLALVRQQAQRLETAGVALGQGSLNAFDEAAWLTLWRLGLPLDALDELADRSVSEAERSDVEALIQVRIGTRQPAAYLTGEAWLQGVPFFIHRRSIVLCRSPSFMEGLPNRRLFIVFRMVHQRAFQRMPPM